MTPPATITVSPSRPPCVLPDLPSPIKLHVVATTDVGRVLLEQADVAALGAYLVALQRYATAATTCIEGGR